MIESLSPMDNVLHQLINMYVINMSHYKLKFHNNNKNKL